MDRCVGTAARLSGGDRKDLAIQVLARSETVSTLIETAKLNGLDPEAYLAHAIDRLARGHLATRLSELLPWNCKDNIAPKAA